MTYNPCETLKTEINLNVEQLIIMEVSRCSTSCLFFTIQHIKYYIVDYWLTTQMRLDGICVFLVLRIIAFYLNFAWSISLEYNIFSSEV